MERSLLDLDALEESLQQEGYISREGDRDDLDHALWTHLHTIRQLINPESAVLKKS